MKELPKHVAIIMDGNGRWAKKQGFLRAIGHENGIGTVRKITEAAAEIGVKFLTLYTFSTENWNRPAIEVKALMELLVKSLRKELPILQKNNIRLVSIGDRDALPASCIKELDSVVESTATHTGLTLILALSYSGKWEITTAVNKLLAQGYTQVDEATISNYLQTKDFPDPDLMIRTGGEHRISNFLLWQLAYSEFYFTDTLWPDFTKQEFQQAIAEYQNRDRRYGGVS